MVLWEKRKQRLFYGAMGSNPNNHLFIPATFLQRLKLLLQSFRGKMGQNYFYNNRAPLIFKRGYKNHTTARNGRTSRDTCPSFSSDSVPGGNLYGSR